MKVVDNLDGTILFKEGDTTTLIKNQDYTWDITEKSGKIYHFDTDGKILSITEKQGRVITLDYTDGLLDTITDTSANSAATITYDNGIIDKIYDPAGNEFDFNYYPEGIDPPDYGICDQLLDAGSTGSFPSYCNVTDT